jgi:hypothetical protein
VALMNEILGPAARFQQLLSRKFGILGGAPSPQLTPEITPEYGLADRPEDLILASEVLASGWINVPSDALHNSLISLENPLGSNLLLVLQEARWQVATVGSNVSGTITNSGIVVGISPGAGAMTFRDTRTTIGAAATYTKPPVGIINGRNGIASTPIANLFYINTQPAATQVFERPVVLSPGWKLILCCVTVALGMNASFCWREVPIAAGEVGPF